MFLVKRIMEIMCAKNSKNTFKSVKVIHGRLQVFFPDRVYIHCVPKNCGIFTNRLLQMVQWVCQWKNVENRLIFGKDMGRFWDTVYI